MARPISVRLAALTSSLVVLGLLGGVPGASAAGGPMYGAPKAGRCYTTPGKVAFTQPATKRPPISCKKKHRLWIVKVKKVPAKIDIDNHKASNKAFWRFESNVCAKSYRLAIGRLDARFGLSSYARFSFVPTRAQRAHGAHWLTCLLGVRAGGKAGKAVKPTKVRTPPRLTRKPSRLMRLCATKALTLTSCANGHTYRARHARVYRSPVKSTKRKALALCRKRLGRAHTWAYAWRGLHGKNRWVLSCLPRAS